MAGFATIFCHSYSIVGNLPGSLFGYFIIIPCYIFVSPIATTDSATGDTTDTKPQSTEKLPLEVGMMCAWKDFRNPQNSSSTYPGSQRKTRDRQREVVWMDVTDGFLVVSISSQFRRFFCAVP